MVRLESASEAKPSPYDEVRDLIADKVVAVKSEVEQRRLLDRLRAQAIIEWKNDELRKLYELHLSRAGATNGLN